jgi:WD40 repeat protein
MNKKLWDVNTRQCLDTLEGHIGSISCCDVSICAVVSPIAVHSVHQGGVESQHLHQSRQRILAVSGSSDETLRVWDVEERRCIAILQGHFESVTCCHMYTNNMNGALVLSGSLDETLKIWEIPPYILRHSGDIPPVINCCHTLSGHEGGITSCAAYTDGAVALSGSFDKTIKVWDIPN